MAGLPDPGGERGGQGEGGAHCGVSGAVAQCCPPRQVGGAAGSGYRVGSVSGQRFVPQ
ncbi:hypothetical protein FNQ90_13265 [Streptomyces alkaliphilus]|uniref:Uncharacterized protein n=1 Tax=Streptomyces alkaliphilus TaxID=1472722 RepID=A0A7W3Y252_9ACTN|nr:hypothetical protein [Streptomyces alkaliphilus]MBB0245051.1 hypothetical protein [Streptomyces alkaliphilus]